MEAIAHLVKCLAKARAVVGRIHLNKAEQGLFNGPLAGHAFFNPVTGDSEISVGIASLSCIACQADFTGHSGALARKNVSG